MENELYAYWLSTIKGIGRIKIGRLLDYFGSEKEIFCATKEMLSCVEGIRDKDVHEILSGRERDKVRLSYEEMIKKNIKFTYRGHADYPDKLKNIYDAPYSLFYKGRLPENGKKAVAVVGARNVSHSGSVVAGKMGKQLAENGVQVISGLARGVDVCAQRATLSIAGSRTFAVMGCGADICYPRQNIDEYMLIQEHGGIISEFAPGMPPVAGNFPMRNRIISGLSDGVLVIEAGKKSGSLITAECAVEQGRDVFVVPGNVDNKLYYGSNELIKNGAALVTDISDVMDALGIFYDVSIEDRKKKIEVVLETSEKIVYASLSLEPAHVSEVAFRTGFTIQRTMEILLELELKHFVVMTGNNYYAVSI